ncbi:MAG: hypothetical protein AWU54_294 [Candidatus Frackibacter sp. T328-2]|nr:MAG: hypothetical protein AWU54_294 [Candidatus Frackibacter sp. T328-2]
MEEVINGINVTIGSKEMVKFKELKFWRTETPEDIQKELDMFSRYIVEKTPEKEKFQIVHTYYVPKDELEFYKEWKDKISKELSQIDKNKILIQSIAQRHGFKLQRNEELDCCNSPADKE